MFSRLNASSLATAAAARLAAAYNSHMEPVPCANCQSLQRREVLSMSSTPSVKDLAEAHCRALEMGLTTPEEIAAWADSVIAATDNPEMGIIEISLHASDDWRMRTHLREVKGIAREQVVLGLLLVRAGTVLRDDPSRWKQVSRVVSRIAGDIGPEVEPTYVLDGRRIASLADFWHEYRRVVDPEGMEHFGYNLDAFRDALHGGGPGWPGSACILRIEHAENACAALGFELFDQLTGIIRDSGSVRLQLA